MGGRWRRQLRRAVHVAAMAAPALVPGWVGLLWGRLALSVESAARAFTWTTCAVYVASFASSYTQIAGMHGPQGILPVGALMPRHTIPLLFRYFKRPDLAMDAVCLGGTLLAGAGMATRRARSSAVLAVLWWFYDSMQRVMNHDPPLLFEAGFIAIFIAQPPSVGAAAVLHRNATRAGMAGARWLLFRLLFGSGFAKLLGGDRIWWACEAMLHHYQSQPIPTPAAWLLHSLPAIFHRASAVATFVVEAAVPLLCFFAPQRGSLRRIGWLAQIGLQLVIGMSGNFGFFNLLTVGLTLPLLANDAVQSGPALWSTGSWRRVERWACTCLVAGVAAAFGPRLRANFTMAQLERTVATFTGVAILLSGREHLHETITGFAAVGTHLRSVALAAAGGGTWWGQMQPWAVFRAVAVPLATTAYFLASLFPFTNGLLAHNVQGSFTTAITAEPGRYILPTVVDTDPWAWPRWLRTLAGRAAAANLCKTYGMFVNLTGAGGFRPELVIEAAIGMKPNGDQGWMELPFRYKPGDTNRRPPWELPHNARLDYSMWLAAAEGADTPGFVAHFCSRLMEGSPHVEMLLDHRAYRQLFPTPPDFVRVLEYEYRFSYAGDRRWWTRKLVACGETLGRDQLSAVAPKIARAYAISIEQQCGVTGRLLMALRRGSEWLSGGSPTCLVWLCLVLPVGGRVMWWSFFRSRRQAPPLAAWS